MRFSPIQPQGWLPRGKAAAICLSIDDVHPGRSTDHYDGGGDLDAGALGLVRQLLDAHPNLKVTLFATADWREISPAPSAILRRIPVIKDRFYQTRVLPKGTRSLARHPWFVEYLKSLPRTEVGLHGLHHIHTGPNVHVEFQDECAAECQGKLKMALSIFEAARLPRPSGMCPPGWNAPSELLVAMEQLAFDYVASARDIRTEVVENAVTAMSGLWGVPLFQPTRVGKCLFHFTSNFQATSKIDRARAILDRRGLLAIKGHIIKNGLGHVAIDGIDTLYCNYLDVLFSQLERDYGEGLWWTTFGEVAAKLRKLEQPDEQT